LVIFFFVIARSAATKQSRRAATILDMAARLLRCARNDSAYYFYFVIGYFLFVIGYFFSSLIIFRFVIARSLATKQSRRTATILDMATRLLRCARNDSAYYFFSSSLVILCFVIDYFSLRHCEERSDEAIPSHGDDPRYGNEIASLRSQ
jgi:hypothetical protein